MITIKEFYGDVKDIDESVLAVKSDCLWEKGSCLLYTSPSPRD